MNKTTDLRTSERVPLEGQVRMSSRGTKAIYALAINISMGGVLLSAAPALQVGSAYQLVISSAQGASIVTEGRVVRSDASGTAIQFSQALGNRSLSTLLTSTSLLATHPILRAYATYFRVGQSPTHEACETLLGISRAQYRAIFLSTFAGCAILATLLAWLFAGRLPMMWSNGTKVLASFAYAGAWLGFVQPTLDLAIIRFVRGRNAATPLS